MTSPVASAFHLLPVSEKVSARSDQMVSGGEASSFSIKASYGRACDLDSTTRSKCPSRCRHGARWARRSGGRREVAVGWPVRLQAGERRVSSGARMLMARRKACGDTDEVRVSCPTRCRGRRRRARPLYPPARRGGPACVAVIASARTAAPGAVQASRPPSWPPGSCEAPSVAGVRDASAHRCLARPP